MPSYSLTLTILPALPPTVTGINIDFASANGGESRTITGTNLTNATVTVDGQAATVSSTTPTSVTFTVPASTVDSTNGNSVVSLVTCTTLGGSASTGGGAGNSLWYVPAYYNVSKYAGPYSAQNVNASAGSIVSVPDMSNNGYTLVPIMPTAPLFSSSGGGSGGNLPFWTTAGSTSALSSSGYPCSGMTTGELVIAMRHLTNSTGVLMTLGQGAVQFSVSFNSITPLIVIQGPALGVTGSNNTDFDLLSYINTAGIGNSQMILNGAAPVLGNGNDATPSTNGINIGSAHTGTGGAPCSIYLAAFSPTALSTTARANWHSYFLNQGIA